MPGLWADTITHLSAALELMQFLEVRMPERKVTMADLFGRELKLMIESVDRNWEWHYFESQKPEMKVI